jgi:superfamily II DNA or RNA helicase
MQNSVEKFLPFYPELTDSKFQQKIYNKKEFRQLKLKTSERSTPKQLLSHQQIISRFISPYTKYSFLLLFHETGTGKTCSSIAVSEHIKQIILSDTKKYNKTLVFVKNDVLEQNFKRELSTVCGNDNYIVKNVNENSKAYTFRLNKLVDRYYDIVTFEKFLTDILEKSDEYIKVNFSNRLIIIDEAHSLRLKHKKQSFSLYEQMHRFLHVVENCRILLLTATPIWDKVNEIATLFNLGLPLDKQIPTGSEFDNLYFKKSELTQKGKIALREFFFGKVSFLRSIVTDIQRIEEGVTSPYTKYIKVFPTEVSGIQYQIIKKSLEEDKKKDVGENQKSKIIYGQSLDASNFVFFDGTCSTEGFEKHVKKEKDKYVLDEDTKNSINGSLDNLKQYSSKFEFIIRSALENPTELLFIYTPIVTGGGAILLGKILELFGYKYVKSGQSIKKDKNFAIISSNVSTSSGTKQIEQLLARFNSPENKYGEYVQILIGSEKISHGVTLKNIRQIHILTSEWNFSSIQQALGRAYRFESHKALPKEERYIKIYKHIAVHKKDQLIDAYLYQVAEKKDYKNHQIYRILKEVSFDCQLTYNRNVLPDDVEDSRDCDYEKCQYSCSTVENEPIDTNTFDLYYNKSDVDIIIHQLKDIFKERNFIFLLELENIFTQYTQKTLLDALFSCIEEFIVFTNKNGYICYLKEEKDIFFLSTNIDKANLDDLVFLDKLFFETSNKISDNIIVENLDFDSKIVEKFCKNCDIKLIDKLHLVGKIVLLENSFLINSKCTEKVKKFFGNSIIYLKKLNTFVHNLYISQTSYNINVYSKETLKNLRAFKDGNWDWANKSVINEYHSLVQKGMQMKKLDSPFGFFGEMSPDGKFRIIDSNQTKGVACSSVKNLLEKSIKAGVTVKNKYKKETEETLQIKLKESNLVLNSLEELQIAASLSDLPKSQLCQLLQERLKELGLLVVL